MSLAVDLMVAGMPSIEAEYNGFSALTPMDASQSVPVSVNNVIVTTAPGTTSVTFAGPSILATPYLTTCETADALLVRPSNSGTINGASQVSCAQNLARMNFSVDRTRWISFITA